jgi:hypothetical protein
MTTEKCAIAFIGLPDDGTNIEITGFLAVACTTKHLPDNFYHFNLCPYRSMNK